MHIIWHLTSPSSMYVPTWERSKVITCCIRGEHVVYCSVKSVSRNPLAMGDQHIVQTIILLCVFFYSVSNMLFQLVPCVLSPFWWLWTCRRCSGLRSVAYFWWLALSSLFFMWWESLLGIGSWIFLMDIFLFIEKIILKQMILNTLVNSEKEKLNQNTHITQFYD